MLVVGVLVTILVAGLVLTNGKVGGSGVTVPTRPAATAAADPVLANQRWPDARVWAHVIPQGLPEYSARDADDREAYGDTYPLDLVEGDGDAGLRATSGVPRALQAGVTGVQVLQFDSNRGSDFVSGWFKQADPTWEDADPKNDFMVAPSLQVSTEDDAVRLIEEYAEAARGHRSAAEADNKLVYYVYDTTALTPAAWKRVRARLGPLDDSLFFIANLETRASQTGRKLVPSELTPYFSVFEGHFTFDDSVEYIWNDLITLMNKNRRQFAGGIQPGSDRQTCKVDSACAHVDAQGTERYRDLWELALRSGTSWQNVLTWNDVVERTEVQASSNWNHTRSDITAFYSAKLRKTAYPRPRAELYITTPQMISLGTAVEAEGMVLNGSTQPVRVETFLVDREGDQVGESSVTEVAAGKAGAAVTLSSQPVLKMPAGRFYRAKARTYDVKSGRLLQEVLSAPVAIKTASAKPTPSLHRLYYSVPASRAMSQQPTLTLSGSPVASAGATAKVSSKSDSAVRFSEVIQNTRQVANGFNTSPFSVRVPMKPRVIVGGQQTSATPDGFYVGRVIDEKERVGYSDPVFVSPG